MSSTCFICGKSFNGYGHNTWPISNEICCDECNLSIVLPKRIELSKEKREKS